MTVPAEIRFWAKVNKDGPIPAHRPDLGPCWIWTAAHHDKGYGRFFDGHRMVPAHRFAYEQARGPIPDGLEPDHLCRNHPCVNYNHFEVVTSQINTLRGIGPTAINAGKTHCPKGHPYDLLNTYVDPEGDRRCRACRWEADRGRSHHRSIRND